jgi:hypothetical protein
MRQGEPGSTATVVWLPARGWPPEAAARRADLESVEKVVTAWIWLQQSSGFTAGRTSGGRATNDRETVVEILHLGQRTIVADQ